MKKKKKILITIILIPIILAFIPIKFTHNSPNEIKEFYIVTCVSEGSTDNGVWIISESNKENKKENWENGIGIVLNGKNPKDTLSYDICNNYTQFIMYGNLTKDFYESYGKEVYILNCYEWQIHNEVKRGKCSFRIPYKHFITIYDLNWFDFLLSDKGY